jgi:HYR domain
LLRVQAEKKSIFGMTAKNLCLSSLPNETRSDQEIVVKRIKGRSGRVISLFLLLGLSLVGLSLMLARPPAVTAAAVPVTNTDDGGMGSLRAAISSAMAGDMIVFNLPAGSTTITLTTDELLINKNLIITGPGANLLTVQRSTAGGTPDFRIFDIADGNFNVTISGLTISNGNAPQFSGGGGGILNLSTGTVNIVNDTITGNSSQIGGDGGGINNGERTNTGFSLIGTVNITNCIISNNAAANTGGGIFSTVTNLNTTNTSTVNITNSTVSGNSAAVGGGVYNQDTQVSTFIVNVTNSTISGNSATASTGGVYNEGNRLVLNITTSTISGNSSGGGTVGAILNIGGTVNLTNSTISGNSAGATGGIRNSGNGTVNITNSTISSNSRSVSGGGGITNDNSTANVVNVKNSIIAGNSGGGSPDLSGTFTSQGYNLIGNNSGATITPTTGDQIGTPAAPIDPLLGPLQNNGGPTFTHALLSGSPATDKGSAATDPVSGNPITTDQRGFTRPVDNPAITNAPGGDGSDIGAFEEQMPTGVACTLTCPANITQSNDPNQCGAAVNYPAPTTSGTCGTVTCSPLSGSFFPKGMTTVTCSEPGGASCSFTVTVNDNEAPVLSGCNSVNANTASNACTAVVTYTQPTANDNCDGVRPVTCGPASGSAFNKGVTTVTCTASDLNTPTTNTGSCTFTVTVKDTQAPTITCPSNVTHGTDPNQCTAVVTYSKATQRTTVLMLERQSARLRQAQPSRRALRL